MYTAIQLICFLAAVVNVLAVLFTIIITQCRRYKGNAQTSSGDETRSLFNKTHFNTVKAPTVGTASIGIFDLVVPEIAFMASKSVASSERIPVMPRPSKYFSVYSTYRIGILGTLNELLIAYQYKK